tara:strand:+ start:221 stop:343 length:123 start_codon:yes stop_codon:yes gene_type:complete
LKEEAAMENFPQTTVVEVVVGEEMASTLIETTCHRMKNTF